MLAVTGITGHMGGFFIDELVKSQYSGKLRCLVRTPVKAKHLLGSGLNAEIVEGSLESDEAVRALLRSADTVIHIAGIRHSRRILRIGRECGVKRFILVHTTGMYSKYKSASGEYLEIEQEIAPLIRNLNITIVRPTMIFGDLCDYNISKFIRFVDKLPVLPVVAGGKALIQPVNARDLAKALHAVLHTPACCGKAYDLSGEMAITIRQLYQMIAQNLGKRRLIISLPMWLCVLGARGLKLITLGKIDIVEKVQRMGEDRAYSHDAAARDLGYTPEPFATGLKREVAQYLAKK